MLILMKSGILLGFMIWHKFKCRRIVGTSPYPLNSVLPLFNIEFNPINEVNSPSIKYSRTRLRRTTLGDKKKYVPTEVRLIRMHYPHVEILTCSMI